jgi:glucose/arabinose dehydrogenase
VHSRRRRIGLAVVAVVLLVGAGALVVASAQGSEGDDGPSPSRAATDRDCPELEAGPVAPRASVGTLRLREVGEAAAPTTAVFRPDGSGDGLLGERGGTVRLIDAGELTDDVVLDLTDDTMQKGDGGLLALAYDPSGDWLYVYRADAAGDDLLTAFPLDGAGRPDPDGGRVLLAVDHPESVQHHGGALAIGRDGLLYLGLGDGGGLGDPLGNAQDGEVLLGKVLRIAPTPADDEPYRIPADNPFVDDPDVAPEVWVLGVRNPFRLGADAATGDLWLGDVGQSCWEEIDHLPTGAEGAGGSNLGWDHLEGNHPFEGGTVPGRVLGPVQEHPHRDGWCGIVAGYVVREGGAPTLDGRLLYSDYCKGDLLALAVDPSDGEPRLLDTGLTLDNPVAIVPGPAGNPWILTLGGEVLELVGS